MCTDKNIIIGDGIIMKRKKTLTLLTVVMACIVITTTGFSANKNMSIGNDLIESKCTTEYPNDAFSKFANIKRDYGSKEQHVAVKVGSNNITKEKIEEQKEVLELIRNEAVSYEEVVKNIASNLLLLEEAKRNNIEITFEEALKLSLEEKKIFDDPNRTPKDQKIAIKEYIKALGISEEEYWNDYHVKENQKYYTIEALNKLVTEKAVKEGKLRSAKNDNTVEIQQYLDRYKDDLYKNAKKEIVDNELKVKLSGDF
jgi:hypothetical protein